MAEKEEKERKFHVEKGQGGHLGLPTLDARVPRDGQTILDEASAAPNPRNAESNKNETKKIDKKMIRGIMNDGRTL